jgi:hypothetical protein
MSLLSQRRRHQHESRNDAGEGQMRWIALVTLTSLAACGASSPGLDSLDARPATLWTTVAAPTSENLLGVWQSGLQVYAVGARGTVLSWVVGGEPGLQASGTTVTLRAVWGSGSTDIYAVGDAGTILHSAGDGTWVPEPLGLAGANAWQLNGVSGAGPNDVRVVGTQNGRPGILRTAGAGAWSAQLLSGNGGLNAIAWQPCPGIFYTVGANAELASSTGGGPWMESPGGSPVTLWSVASSPSSAIPYAVGAGGAILSPDQSGTWSVQSAPANADLYGVAEVPDRYILDPNTAFAVGARGTVLRSYLGSGSWTPEPSGTTADLYAVEVSDSGLDLFAVGAHGTVLQRR